MSDVAQGPGWWLASDGRWYAPELHPQATNGAPGVPAGQSGGAVPAGYAQPGAMPAGYAQPGAVPAGTVPQVGVPVGPAPYLPPTSLGTPRSGREWYEPEAVWVDATFTSHVDQSEFSGQLRRSVDARGAFVALVSLVLVSACFVPYYTVPGAIMGTVGSGHLPVVSHLMGSWRLVIPAVCILTVLVGIANSLLRVGHRGAVGVFVLLRVVVFVQLGVWVLPIFEKTVYKPPSGLPPTSVGVAVGWVAYSCALIAAVGIVGSFAAMGKSDTT